MTSYWQTNCQFTYATETLQYLHTYMHMLFSYVCIQVMSFPGCILHIFITHELFYTMLPQ